MLDQLFHEKNRNRSLPCVQVTKGVSVRLHFTSQRNQVYSKDRTTLYRIKKLYRKEVIAFIVTRTQTRLPALPLWIGEQITR